MDFSKHSDVLAGLRDSQESEYDLRTYVREAHHFVDKRDGQWDPDIITKMKNRPRYTLDKTGPIVDQVTAEVSNSDYTIRVSPTGGGGSDENAKIYDGLIRTIRNISNAERVFKAAVRSAIIGGIDGWEVVQDYIDADSFDQDLIIKKIHNYVDRVWFDPHAEEVDNSDAKWVVVETAMSAAEFEKEFDMTAGGGLGESRLTQVYEYKPGDQIVIGKLLYKKPRNIELVKMNDGSVFRVDDDFKKVERELKLENIFEVDRRTRKGWRVHSRLFNNDEWLSEEEETVFDYLPVCGMYGNYSVSENKRIYRGIVEKMLDPQRIYNGLSSRKVEEVVLAPRDKFWMTKKQAKGNMAKLRTLNNNYDPVQFYEPDGESPPPFRTGGAQVNQGLAEMVQAASGDLSASAGIFSSNMGDNPNLQSGVALDIQTDKGNNGMAKWVEMMETAICYTGKVLVNAIPRVYDGTRTIQILGVDGKTSEQTINKVVMDEETRQPITLNNLASGQYDAVCRAGAAFKTRQKESAAAFIELATIDPRLIEEGGDILLNNIDQEGMSEVSERRRMRMVMDGTIPEKQLTDEEKQMIQQMQEQAAQQAQQQAADPMMIAAEAEKMKGEADLQSARNKEAEIQGNLQIKSRQQNIEEQKIKLETEKFMLLKQDKFNKDEAQIELEARKVQVLESKEEFNQWNETEKLKAAETNDSFTNAETLRKAMGVDSVVGPNSVEAYKDQIDIIQDNQDQE